MRAPLLTRWHSLHPLRNGTIGVGPYSVLVDEAGVIAGFMDGDVLVRELPAALEARMRAFPRVFREEHYPDPSWVPAPLASAPNIPPVAAVESAPVAVEPPKAPKPTPAPRGRRPKDQ